jgi:hypothetical protein
LWHAVLPPSMQTAPLKLNEATCTRVVCPQSYLNASVFLQFYFRAINQILQSIRPCSTMASLRLSNLFEPQLMSSSLEELVGTLCQLEMINTDRIIELEVLQKRHPCTWITLIELWSLTLLEKSVANLALHLLNFIFSILEELIFISLSLLITLSLLHLRQILIVLLRKCIHLLLWHLLSSHKLNLGFFTFHQTFH